jgi:Uma2 family endonuclease
MSTAPSLPLMTAEQFFALPEPAGAFIYELHFGELVKVGRPKKKHFDLQSLVRDLLERVLGTKRWRIEIEMPYGLAAGYDVRAADVGVALRKTWDAVPEDGYLIGSPHLVVHIKSRSNRDRRMEEDAISHITHGASAVWLVKPERREIVVVTGSSRTVYGAGERIEMAGPFSTAIAVDEIFPG